MQNWAKSLSSIVQIFFSKKKKNCYGKFFVFGRGGGGGGINCPERQRIFFFFFSLKAKANIPGV